MVDFEYTRSRGAHGVHALGQFDAFVGSDREIWIGSDFSGLIRESRGPTSFFTAHGPAQWQAAGAPLLEHEAGIDLFAPGCLGGSRRLRTRTPKNLDLRSALNDRLASLHDVQELLGEAVVTSDFVRESYEVARRLPGVEDVGALSDQVGRVGRGLASIEHRERVELVFAANLSELLGYQWFLAEDHSFAQAGTLHSWSAFLERKIVDRLPEGVPPIPRLPCETPGARRGFSIRRGFTIGTGYASDPAAQLAELRAQGVITDREHDEAVQPFKRDTDR